MRDNVKEGERCNSKKKKKKKRHCMLRTESAERLRPYSKRRQRVSIESEM